MKIYLIGLNNEFNDPKEILFPTPTMLDTIKGSPLCMLYQLLHRLFFPLLPKLNEKIHLLNLFFKRAFPRISRARHLPL